MNHTIKRLQLQLIAYLSICFVLSLLSIYSTLGTFVMFIERGAKSSEMYNMLMTQKIETLKLTNCVILTPAQLKVKQQALADMLQTPTTNSRSASAGALGNISNNCTGNNWYTKNRCGTYLAQKAQLAKERQQSQKCNGLKAKLQTIEAQLEDLPPSDNLALFTLISKVSTYTTEDLIFLTFVCLAILIESAIIFQTFSYNRKGTLASLILLIRLVTLSIGLNTIFWSSLGNFSTGFQIFSAIVGIILDILKINFMLDISDIYLNIKQQQINPNHFRIINGDYQRTEKPTENRMIEETPKDSQTDVPKITQFDKLNLISKDIIEQALEKGDIACDKDEILNYLRVKYHLQPELHIIEGWIKDFHTYYPAVT